VRPALMRVRTSQPSFEGNTPRCSQLTVCEHRTAQALQRFSIRVCQTLPVAWRFRQTVLLPFTYRWAGNGLTYVLVSRLRHSSLRLRSNSLLPQNVVTDASISWVVDSVLPANASAPVASWAQGAAYIDGIAVNQSRGSLPLPTEADAAHQGVPFVCGALGGALCGGSSERPATGIPHRPRPLFEDDLGVLNALDAGAKVRATSRANYCVTLSLLGTLCALVHVPAYAVDRATARPTIRQHCRPHSRPHARSLSPLESTSFLTR
jgi:hypothetical protein